MKLAALLPEPFGLQANWHAQLASQKSLTSYGVTRTSDGVIRAALQSGTFAGALWLPGTVSLRGLPRIAGAARYKNAYKNGEVVTITTSTRACCTSGHCRSPLASAPQDTPEHTNERWRTSTTAERAKCE